MLTNAIARFHKISVDDQNPPDWQEDPEEPQDNSLAISKPAQVGSNALSLIMAINSESVCSALNSTDRPLLPSIAATCRSSAACSSPSTCFLCFISALSIDIHGKLTFEILVRG